MGDCPGPREGATTRRNVTRGGQRRKKSVCTYHGPQISGPFDRVISFFMAEETLSDVGGGDAPPPHTHTLGVLKQWPGARVTDVRGSTGGTPPRAIDVMTGIARPPPGERASPAPFPPFLGRLSSGPALLKAGGPLRRQGKGGGLEPVSQTPPPIIHPPPAQRPSHSHSGCGCHQISGPCPTLPFITSPPPSPGPEHRPELCPSSDVRAAAPYPRRAPPPPPKTRDPPPSECMAPPALISGRRHRVAWGDHCCFRCRIVQCILR